MPLWCWMEVVVSVCRYYSARVCPGKKKSRVMGIFISSTSVWRTINSSVWGLALFIPSCSSFLSPALFFSFSFHLPCSGSLKVKGSLTADEAATRWFRASVQSGTDAAAPVMLSLWAMMLCKVAFPAVWFGLGFGVNMLELSQTRRELGAKQCSFEEIKKNCICSSILQKVYIFVIQI